MPVRSGQGRQNYVDLSQLFVRQQCACLLFVIQHKCVFKGANVCNAVLRLTCCVSLSCCAAPCCFCTRGQFLCASAVDGLLTDTRIVCHPSETLVRFISHNNQLQRLLTLTRRRFLRRVHTKTDFYLKALLEKKNSVYSKVWKRLRNMCLCF